MSTDEHDVRALIDAWYAELKLGEEGHPWRLFAPGAIIASRSAPTNAAPPGAAGVRPVGPPFPNELIRRAGRFAYEIDNLRLEGGLAKVRVWERAWIYAWAANQTYENAAEAHFVLERMADGKWLILAFQSSSQAVHPKHKNEPMPDLSPGAKQE